MKKEPPIREALHRLYLFAFVIKDQNVILLGNDLYRYEQSRQHHQQNITDYSFGQNNHPISLLITSLEYIVEMGQDAVFNVF